MLTEQPKAQVQLGLLLLGCSLLGNTKVLLEALCGTI